MNCFAYAYEVMLWKLRCQYPYAAIYCGLLCPPAMSFGRKSARLWGFYDLEDYNRAIRSCAMKYGCYVADLPRYVKCYETTDGFHPNPAGLKQLEEGWTRAILEPERGSAKGRKKWKNFAAAALLAGAGGAGILGIFLALFVTTH